MGKIVIFCDIKHDIMKKTINIYDIMDFYEIKVAQRMGNYDWYCPNVYDIM